MSKLNLFKKQPKVSSVFDDDYEFQDDDEPIGKKPRKGSHQKEAAPAATVNKVTLTPEDLLKQSEALVKHESERLLSEADLAFIRNDISNRQGLLMMEAMTDDTAKAKLRDVILSTHRAKFNKSYSAEDNADYITDELVGTGLIERLIETDDTITDIEWDGHHLTVISNDSIVLAEGSSLYITEDYVNRLIQKFVVINESDFTPNQALFNGMYGNMRMSATHKSTSPYGTTFSLRVSKSRLALNESNWTGFAPAFVLEWFRVLIMSRVNVVIAGETGAGKTELQKFLLGLAEPLEKFYVIEDVLESHLKELYPDRRIFSTLTNAKYTIGDHVKHALRNNPEWIVVAETRSSEAYEMLQAVLSGHNIITTVHAIDARAIPHRFINMCLSGYTVSEKMLHEDIYRYFDLGIHIKRARYKNKIYRYLSELVEYNPDGTATTLFKQMFRDGEFHIKKIGSFSDEVHDKIYEKGLSIIDGDDMVAMVRDGIMSGLPEDFAKMKRKVV